MKKLLIIFLILFLCSPVCARTNGYREIIDQSSRLNFNVVSSVEGKSDKLILFIEDAHCNYVAQKEVASIIGNLVGSGQFQLITVEGSEGEILTHLFSSFPKDNIRKKYSEKLLKNGLISGEEYFSIFQGNPIRIYGVDDREIYKRNIDAFKNFFSLYNESYDVLDKLRYGFFSIKEENYNDLLFEFEKKCIAYKQKTINLDQLISYCAANISGYDALIVEFSELKKLDDVINIQKKFDYKLLDKQTRELTNYINKTCSSEVSRECKSLVFSHLTGKMENREFYQKLLSVAHNNIPNDPDLYSNLTKYIEITEAVNRINYKNLNIELTRFLESCYSKLLKTLKEKEIFALSNEFEIYENIFNLTLTRSEYQKWLNSVQDNDRFSAFLDDYNKFSENECVPDEECSMLASLFYNNVDFYHLAAQRDNVIFKNTCSLIENENLSNVILVAGGFHSEKIFEDCRANDISCIVIRPHNVGESDFKQYARALLREDIFSENPDIINYPDKLRATSFFAENSFDDVNRINEFRNEFIFNAVAESLDTFSYNEIFEIVKAWRNGFEKAVNARYPDNPQRTKQALDMFDYIVTDVFSFGNVDIDSPTQSITISSAGQTIKIIRQPDSSIVVEPVSTVSKLDQAMRLKTEPILLENSQVFISSWTIADEESEFLGHGDAHYSVKYIESLNLRGIEPVVILPDDHDEIQRTLNKYLSAVKGMDLKFQFAIYEQDVFILLDSNGVPQSRMDIAPDKKPLIIQLCSKIDPKNAERMAILNNRLKELTNTIAEPVFLRIPTAGTEIDDTDLNHFDMYFNPAPAGFSQTDSIQTGFMIDEELLTIVKEIKKQGRELLRNQLIVAVSDISGDRLYNTLESIDGFHFDDIASSHWTFRYLTEKSDAELSSFMKSLSVKTEPQVVFTFYSDKSDKDIKHKKFLKDNFKFIDLEQEGNDRTDIDSNILIINVPPLTSDVFKRLMAVSDAAVVSGENSLMEGLIFNKLGIGPALLFKPAMAEHLSVLSTPLSSAGRTALMNKIDNYAELLDDPRTDYFSSFDKHGQLNDTERFIYDLMFDPRTNTLVRSVFASIVPSINGLNVLTDVIDKIDKKAPVKTIVKSYSLAVEANAAELVNEFFIDDELDFTSSLDQVKFVESKLKPYIRDFLVNLAERDIQPQDMKQALANFVDNVYRNYRLKLEELGNKDITGLSQNMSVALADFLSGIFVAENGAFFMPVGLDLNGQYEYIYIDKQAFSPNYDEMATPRPVFASVTNNKRLELLERIRNIQLAKELILNVGVVNLFTYEHYNEFMPTYSQTSLQKEVLLEHLAEILLDSYLDLLDRYSDVLLKYNTVPDMLALLNFITHYRSTSADQSIDKIPPKENSLISEVVKISVAVQTQAHQAGVTYFYRMFDFLIDDYESYIDDLVASKVQNGDFSITIRSVGASTGKEAYSVAAVLEQSLLKYAMNNIYAHVENEAERKKLADSWIDLWDVKVHAFEVSCARLSLGSEGLYKLESQDRLALNPQRREMFDRMYDPEMPVNVKIKDRLKRWFNPIYCDLDGDLSVLFRNPGEITFAMNFLTYLKDRDSVLAALMMSTSSEYKSFFSYNESFDEEPVDHNLLEGQPLVIPPTQLPSRDELVFISIINDFPDRSQLAAYLGIKIDDVNAVLDSEFKTEDAFDYIDLYTDQLDDLVSSFFNSGDIDLKSANQNKIFEQFIDSRFREFVESYVMALSRLKISPEDISDQLDFFVQQMVRVYNDNLQALGVDQLTGEPQVILDEFLANTHILPYGHLLMPQKLGDNTHFMHTYLNLRTLVPKNDTEQTNDVITAVVSSGTQQRLVSDLSDTQYIAGLLVDMDLDMAAIFAQRDDEDENQFTFNIHSDPAGTEIALSRIAVSLLDPLRRILNEHASHLESLYGTADMQSLCSHMSYLSTKDSFSLDNTVDRDILVQYGNIESALNKQYFNDSLSGFFRSHEYWVDRLKNFMDDVIAQKVVNNDLTFSIRSLGSSFGKEAYSLAAVLEQSLLKYAMENLFKGRDDAEQLAAQWISSWNIKIYAFDESFKRLLVASEGLTDIGSNEKDFFTDNPEFASIIEGSYVTSSASMNLVRIRPELRSWIVPVYCNFNKDLTPIQDHPAEVTFAMNVVGYLESPADFEKEIKNSGNPRYKSFLAYNRVLSSPPNVFGEPFERSPVDEPSVFELANAIVFKRINTPEKLSQYFGVNKNRINAILATPIDAINFSAQQSYIPIARKLVSGLVGVHDLLENVDSDQSIFVNTLFRDFIPDFIMSLASVNMERSNIDSQLSVLADQMIKQYANILTENGFQDIDAIRQSFSEKVQTFLNSITIAGNSHVFIPRIINGSRYFEHTFVSANPFDPITENRDIVEQQTELVSEVTKDALVQDINDIELVRPIVDLFDYQFDFTNYMGDFLPTYDESDLQISKLKTSVAYSMLDYIRILNNEYSSDLQALYADSSLSLFVNLIKEILTVDQAEQFNDFRDELRIKILAFRTEVKHPEQVSGMDRDIRKFGRTYFFRNNKNWLNDLENYLDDLILQKVSNGDLSLSIRSIGSATGRESYAIGVVVEQRLLAYAREHLFNDITSETQKEKLSQQWVDKWDVNLYILDISFHRLAAAKEGLYRLFNIEKDFFELHPEYKAVFSDIIYTRTPPRHPLVAKVSNRLKRWAVPVYINLNSDLSPLERTTSEISFVKNVLRFVNDPSKVINAVLDSTNSGYKSFFGYNHVNESPMVFSELQGRFSGLEENAHILPPSNKIDPETVYNLILKAGMYESKPIADVLGISEAELAEIYDEDTFFQAVGFVDAYLEESDGSVQLSIFDKNLRKCMTSVAMTLAKKQLGTEELKNQLNNFVNQAAFMLNDRLSGLKVEQAAQQAEAYKERIDAYLSKITLAPQGHIFVPVVLDGKEMFEHSYMDWQAFLTNYDVSRPITEPVSEWEKERILSDLEDLKYARELIKTVDVESLYVDFTQRKHIPYYEGNDLQFNILSDRIALIALGQFRLLIDKYRDTLIAAKGKADMQAFTEYILDYTIRTEHFREDKEVPPVIDDYILLVNAIVPSKQIAPGVTHFFRKYNDWCSHYETYLRDVIPQKVASGDFTFVLRSVGSSNGKEAYSILAILEHELKTYATENLFQYAGENEREALVEQWLDLWDIKCYAYDTDFTRLATMYEGVYSGLISLKMFLETHPDYKDMLDVFYPSSDKFIRMNQRLRRWIAPVYCDLEGDLTAVSSHKAEITFSFNTFPYLDAKTGSTWNLQKTLLSSSSDAYKSFLGYNVNFEGAPVALGLLDEQPLVVPPAVNPAMGHIATAVLRNGLTSLAELSVYFGLKEESLAEVLANKQNLNEEDSFFLNQLAKGLLSDFADLSLDWQTADEQVAFIENHYKPFIKDLFVKLTELNIKPYIISQVISGISSNLSLNYGLLLQESSLSDANQLVELFSDRVSDFMNETRVLENGHLILPDMINSVDCYDHIYFKQRAFYQDDSPVLMSEPVPVSALDDLIVRLEEYQAIRQLIDSFGLYELFTPSFSDDVIPGYGNTEQQTEALKDHMTVVLHEYVTQILNKHTTFFTNRFGKVSIKVFVDHVVKMNSGTVELTADEKDIMKDFETLGDIMQDDPGRAGLTGFFRNDENWYKQYRNYLKDVIAQKTDSGDFTFSARSIGSSTGKEAYSIAAILEQELENYAYDNIFQYIPDDKQRREAAKEWVDLWDVKVYAFDTNIQRLTASLEGIYHADASWTEFIGSHPEYREKFHNFNVTDDPLSLAISVDDRLRRWIQPLYANLNENLDVLDRYQAEITFAMNVMPYLDYAETFMTKLTSFSSNRYKMFVAYNENFSSPPNKHYLLDHQSFTIPLAKNPTISEIARSIYRNELQFIDQTAAFWGVKKEKFVQLINDQRNLDQDAFNPIVSGLLQDLFANTFFKGVRMDDHEEFINTIFRDFTRSYVISLSQNNFTPETIRRILNIIKENLVSAYSDRLLSEFHPNASRLSLNLAKRMEDFLSVIDILPNSILIMPVLLDGEIHYEKATVDLKAFLYERQEYGAFSVVSDIISGSERDNIIAQQDQIQQITQILKASGFEKSFFELYEDFYISDNRDVVLAHIYNSLLDYFSQMPVKYQSLLQRVYAKADLANFAVYIEDLYGNQDHLSQPEDESIMAELQLLTRQTEEKFDRQNDEAFFNLSESWNNDFSDYLNDLITMKTALKDFTLSVRSLGALTGKEAYSAAVLVERAILSYAEKYVYADIESVENRKVLAQKWLEKWNVQIFALDSNLHNLSIAKDGVFNVSQDGSDIERENTANMKMFSTMRLVGKDYIKTGRVKSHFRNWVIPVFADFESNLSVLERYPAEITFALNTEVNGNPSLEQKIRSSVKPSFKSYLLFKSKKGTPANVGVVTGQPHVLAPLFKPDKRIIQQVIDSPYSASFMPSTEATAAFFCISLGELNDILKPVRRKPSQEIDRLQKVYFLIDAMM